MLSYLMEYPIRYAHRKTNKSDYEIEAIASCSEQVFDYGIEGVSSNVKELKQRRKTRSTKVVKQ